MARKVTTLLLDDLSEGDVPADETVWFGLDGTSYLIDLSAKNADALRDSLAAYVDAARKASSGGVKKQAQRTDKAVTQAIRAWAAQNNWELKSRGRIPHEIVEAYNASSA